MLPPADLYQLLNFSETRFLFVQKELEWLLQSAPVLFWPISILSPLGFWHSSLLSFLQETEPLAPPPHPHPQDLIF